MQIGGGVFCYQYLSMFESNMTNNKAEAVCGPDSYQIAHDLISPQSPPRRLVDWHGSFLQRGPGLPRVHNNCNVAQWGGAAGTYTTVLINQSFLANNTAVC
jgi:hypothetical protein